MLFIDSRPSFRKGRRVIRSFATVFCDEEVQSAPDVHRYDLTTLASLFLSPIASAVRVLCCIGAPCSARGVCGQREGSTGRA